MRCPEIYAVSFLIGDCPTETVDHFPCVELTYNTEKDCSRAPKYSEERWNIAFWTREPCRLIDADDDSGRLFLEWCEKQGLENVGVEEDWRIAYDEDDEYKYIGKGPAGFYELFGLLSNIAQELQTNGFIKSKFGEIPLLIHDLEYCWYAIEATRNANPNGEADVFLKAMEEIGII